MLLTNILIIAGILFFVFLGINITSAIMKLILYNNLTEEQKQEVDAVLEGIYFINEDDCPYCQNKMTLINDSNRKIYKCDNCNILFGFGKSDDKI